jgi:hypothetical protein
MITPDDWKARITSFEGSIIESCERLGTVIDPAAGSYLKNSTEAFINAVDDWAEKVADLPIVHDTGFVEAVSGSMDEAVQYFHDQSEPRTHNAAYFSPDRIDNVLSDTAAIINAPLQAVLPGTKLDYEPPPRPRVGRGGGPKLDYEPPNRPKTR